MDRRAIRCPGRPRPWDYLGSPRGAGITIGFWPEDIGFSATPLPDYGPATVWATDFRGRDQAVEARFGAHRTRRVVSTRDRFSEGDACFIRPIYANEMCRPTGAARQRILLWRQWLSTC